MSLIQGPPASRLLSICVIPRLEALLLTPKRK
jgi:hypothetical protein